MYQIMLRCLFATVIFEITDAHAQPCGSTVLNSPAQFSQRAEYAGRIAWRPNGLASQQIHIISNCFTIPLRADAPVSFVIGNATQKQAESEVATFVYVQVLRHQILEQAEQVTIDRNLGWRRNRAELRPIQDQVPDGLSLAGFVNAHKNADQNQTGAEAIMASGIHWHGIPDGSLFSSIEYRTQIAAANELILQDKKIKTSNRILRFELNSGGSVGVPFLVYTRGTEMIDIKTSSPNRPEFDNSIRINLQR